LWPVLLFSAPSARNGGGEELVRENFQRLVKRFEAEKELEPGKRLDTIKEFRLYQIPECARFLAKTLPQEKDTVIVREMMISCIVLDTPETVKAAVTQGLPGLTALVQLSDKPEPLIPPAWRYRTPKGWRMLPRYYFDEIAGSLAAVRKEKTKAWIVKHGLEGPVARDPLWTKFMITVIARIPHPERGKSLRRALQKFKDPQVIATVFDAARRAQLKDSQFARNVARYLRFRSRDAALCREVQVAAAMCLEKTAPELLKRELPKLFKSKISDVRMLAVGAALRCGADPKLIRPLLDDPDWRVRLSAFRTVGKLATEEAVTLLIARLKKERYPRAIDDLLDTLRRLTGVDMGRFPFAWEAWWKSNRNEADIRWRDAAELGSIKAQKGSSTRTASYYGLEVLSKFACFLLDTSRSMVEKYDVPVEEDLSGVTARTKAKARKRNRRTVRKRKIDYARENLKKVLKRLSPDLKLNIITFNHDARAWRDTLVPNTEANRADAFAFLDNLEPSGSTNIFDTLVLALSDENVDTIYLLSDGAPTTGTYTDPVRILEEIRRINLFRKVKINTIGFNLKGKAWTLMRDLAEENFGAFVAR